MKKNITFTNTLDFLYLEKPLPASKILPNWYKEADSYVAEGRKPSENKNTTATIKRCMPVFDAMTAGYIIVSPADVYVSMKEGIQYFEWATLGLIAFHAVEQAPTHPARNKHAYPKWINHWAIKTPKGYSTMFVQPMHRESVFTILPAIVDTDTFYAPVHFPMVINDPNFEGLIPKGTPIAQVIPFKRDSWGMQFGGKKDQESQEQLQKKLATKFFDKYKTMFRSKKEYK
jgi:hypothetical protein